MQDSDQSLGKADVFILNGTINQISITVPDGEDIDPHELFNDLEKGARPTWQAGDYIEKPIWETKDG